MRKTKYAALHSSNKEHGNHLHEHKKTCRDSKASDKQTALTLPGIFFFRREAWEGSFSDKPKTNHKSAVLMDPTETQTLLQKLWISREVGRRFPAKEERRQHDQARPYCILLLPISPGAEVQQNWMSLKTAKLKMTSFVTGKGKRQTPEAHTCMQIPAVGGHQQLHAHPETCCSWSS